MNFSTVTTATSMFLNCVKLSRIPQFNFISLGSAATMFDGCSSLTIIPAINMSALTVSTTGFRNCFSLTKILAYGLKGFVNVANNMLSRASLELLFKNLGNDSSTPIDITGNYGADAPIVRNVGQVAGSTTYTMVDTTNVVVGMTIQTLGNRTAVMQAGGINVGTLANHGLTNGKLLYITGGTATGIPNRVPHYVINATTNTFHMSLTVGGPSITVVTNGNLGFNVYGIVTSVTPGVGFTSDIPAIATGTSTPAIRLLDTSQASAKGYTITG